MEFRPARISAALTVALSIAGLGSNASGSQSQAVSFRSAYLHTAIGGGRQIQITGIPGGSGQLTLNPNAGGLTEYGDVGVTTLIVPHKIPVELRPVTMAKQDRMGRQLFDLVSAQLQARLRLVLSPQQAESARLLELDERGQVSRVVTLERMAGAVPISPAPAADSALLPETLTFKTSSWIGRARPTDRTIEWSGTALEYDDSIVGSPVKKVFGSPFIKTAPSLSSGKAQRKSVVPSAEQWQRFWKALEMAAVWDWKTSYEANVPPNVTSGIAWELTIARGDRRVTSRGRNAYPANHDPRETGDFRTHSVRYARLKQALQILTGEEDPRFKPATKKPQTLKFAL